MPTSKKNMFATILPGLAIVLLITFSSFAQIPEASFPPFVRVPPTEKPPVIDGVISPGEWDSAFMGSGITPYRRGGLDPVQAQYWFAYDSSNIYVAARMQTHPSEVFDKPARRLAGGGPMGRFEILIDPYPCHVDHNWVQAMLYPLGKYKNLGYSQRIGGYIPYEVEWDYKDSFADGWWNVEISAPVSSFHGGRIKEGEAWGVLYAGYTRFPAPLLPAFSGQLGDVYRNRSRYIKMFFDHSAPVIQIRSMGDIMKGKITPEISVRNTSSKRLDLKAEFAVRDALVNWKQEFSREEKKLTLGANAEGIFTWETATPEKDKTQYLFMTVKDSGGVSLYEGIYKIQAPRSQVWGELPAPSTDPVIFEAYFYPYFNRVKAVADFGGLADTENISSIRYRVADPGGKVIAAEESNEFDNRASEIILQLPEKLAVGRYTVTATIMNKNGKTVFEGTDATEKKQFPFEHNTLGISDKVLYPWTPIQVDKKTNIVSVWNRKYTLDATGFPGQVETAGAKILSAPITIMEIVNGKRLPLKGAGVTFTKTAEHRIDAVALATGRKVQAKIGLLGEYDGMLKYELTITGEKDAVVDGLELVIPLNEENAGFIHATGDGCRSNISKELPKSKGKVFDSTEVLNWTMRKSWLTYVWLGDYERGLCWWADSAEGWTLPGDNSKPTVNVYRKPGSSGRNGTIELVFRIIDAPATVLWRNEAPRRIVFAIEATPVRPRPTWARDIGLIPVEITRQKFPRFEWIGNTYWTFLGQEEANKTYPGTYAFGHLRPINAAAEEELRKRTAKAHEAGKHVHVYTDMRNRSLAHDEPKYYAWEFATTRDDIRKKTIENMPYHGQIRISSTQSRIDYDLWCFNSGMDNGIDSWFFDEIQDEGQINPAADLGYQDENGKWMPTGRLFQYRQLWKRLYTMMQDRGQQEPLIRIHNTSTTYAGPMAFATAILDIEDINADPTSRHMTMYGMGYLVAETMGRQYGFVSSVCGPLGPPPLHTFESWLREHPEEIQGAARHWVGVHMLLDMNPYLVGQYGERSLPVVAGLKMLGEFGWNNPDCEWIPFWKGGKQQLYSMKPSSDKKVYASMYRRPGKALVIILNDTNAPVTVEWRPSRDLKVERVVDAEAADKEIRAAGGSYKVEIPHFNYRALLMYTE